MAERMKINIPKKISEKYGENVKIWSFSKCSSIDNCIYEYYLSRIKKKTQSQNVYTLAGNISHSILEDFYNGKIEYNDMSRRFETDFLGIELGGFKFSNDEDKNKRMRNNYKENMSLFFKNHIPVKCKVVNEKEIWVNINDFWFIGYIDALHKDHSGNYIVTDYKTSGLSDYTGAKKHKKAMQLLLYALALNQLGVPMDRIKCRWNFLKYTKVGITYKVKSKKELQYKETIAERIKWVDKVKTQLRKDMVAFYTDWEEWEIDLKLHECIKNNNLDSLDKSISENYVLSDAYEYIEVNEETIQSMKDYLVEKIAIVESKNSDNEDDWSREDIPESGNFYCATLCSVRNHCKYWKKYMEQREGCSTGKGNSIVDELDALLNL